MQVHNKLLYYTVVIILDFNFFLSAKVYCQQLPDAEFCPKFGIFLTEIEIFSRFLMLKNLRNFFRIFGFYLG